MNNLRIHEPLGLCRYLFLRRSKDGVAGSGGYSLGAQVCYAEEWRIRLSVRNTAMIDDLSPNLNRDVSVGFMHAE